MSLVKFPKLIAFFVYNPTISRSEHTTHYNVLYYYPPTEHINTQMNEVGFCTATCALQSRFSVDRNESHIGVSRSITTTRKRYTLLEVEPNFWFVVVTSRGPQVLASSAPGAKQKSNAHHRLPQSIDDDDKTIQQVADSCMRIHYGSFKMLFGPLAANLEASFKEEANKNSNPSHSMKRLLRRALATKLVPFLMHALCVPAQYMLGTFAIPKGIEYLSVNSAAYLSVASFVGCILQASNGAVKHAAVCYQTCVIHSTLTLQDTFTLFRLLTDETPPAPEYEEPFSDTEASTAIAVGQNREEALRASVVGPRRPRSRGDHLSSPTPAQQRKSIDITNTTSADFGFSEDLRKSLSSSSDFGLSIPSIYIEGELVGVITYCVKEFRIILIASEAVLKSSILCKGVVSAVQAVMDSHGHQKLQSIVLPSMKSSKDLDDRFAYHYLNMSNLAVKSSVLMRRQYNDELETVHVMDHLRMSLLDPNASMMLDGSEGSQDMGMSGSVLVRIRGNTYVSCLRSGQREFCLTFEASTIDDAVAQVRQISKYVFVGIFVD